MSVTDEPDESMHLSVEDMRDWLDQEIKDLNKAKDLRIKEATAFVEAYANGKLTAEEASRRLMNYEDRWGDAPLLGTHAMPHMIDEAIIAKIDSAHATLDAKSREYHRRMATVRVGLLIPQD